MFVSLSLLSFYPGSIEVLLDSWLGASSWLDDLSIGCQDGQQSEGKHLEGVHLFLHNLQVTQIFTELRKLKQQEQNVSEKCTE